MLDICLENVNRLNLAGRGGKENVIQSILPRRKGWERKNHILYDYHNDITQTFVECKKQKNLQWLDPSKYCNITDSQKSIQFMFVVIDDRGAVDIIFTLTLGDLMDRIWSDEHVRDAWEYIQKYPKDQIKSSLKTRDFYRDNQDVITTLYRK